jgi:hypothetical protein
MELLVFSKLGTDLVLSRFLQYRICVVIRALKLQVHPNHYIYFVIRANGELQLRFDNIILLKTS